MRPVRPDIPLNLCIGAGSGLGLGLLATGLMLMVASWPPPRPPGTRRSPHASLALGLLLAGTLGTPLLFPLTLAFRTGLEEMRILQVTGIRETPPTVELHYRLLQGEHPDSSADAPPVHGEQGLSEPTLTRRSLTSLSGLQQFFTLHRVTASGSVAL